MSKKTQKYLLWGAAAAGAYLLYKKFMAKPAATAGMNGIFGEVEVEAHY